MGVGGNATLVQSTTDVLCTYSTSVGGGGGEEYGTRGNTAKDFGSTLNFRN